MNGEGSSKNKKKEAMKSYQIIENSDLDKSLNEKLYIPESKQ